MNAYQLTNVVIDSALYNVVTHTRMPIISKHLNDIIQLIIVTSVWLIQFCYIIAS